MRLEAEQGARIETQMRVLRDVLPLTDQRELKRAISALNETTVSFAQARMDKSVSLALSGKNISDLEVK